MKHRKGLSWIVIGVFLFSGCSQYNELIKMNERQRATIQSLTSEVDRLNRDIDQLSESQQGLQSTKAELERQLQDQIQSGDLGVEMKGRGLVVTILNNILFDSGKAEIKASAANTLMTVGKEINQVADEQVIYVEGHTDSDPIRHAKFKSNWELSTTRATEVVHFLVNKAGVSPKRVVASGYGEFRPTASNATQEGKAKNRRVEIIISPESKT